jgi:hypothetical protein
MSVASSTETTVAVDEILHDDDVASILKQREQRLFPLKSKISNIQQSIRSLRTNKLDFTGIVDSSKHDDDSFSSALDQNDKRSQQEPASFAPNTQSLGDIKRALLESGEMDAMEYDVFMLHEAMKSKLNEKANLLQDIVEAEHEIAQQVDVEVGEARATWIIEREELLMMLEDAFQKEAENSLVIEDLRSTLIEAGNLMEQQQSAWNTERATLLAQIQALRHPPAPAASSPIKDREQQLPMVPLNVVEQERQDWYAQKAALESMIAHLEQQVDELTTTSTASAVAASAPATVPHTQVFALSNPK